MSIEFNKDELEFEPIKMPELLVYQATDRIVKSLKEDLKIAASFEETFIYRAFQTQAADQYYFAEQMVDLFNKPDKDPKSIQTRLFFDAKRAEIPTIHINLPSESPGENGLGSDEGLFPPVFNDERFEFVRQFTRRFKANYQVLITSSNSLECIAIYHLLRAAFIANQGGLEYFGLENLALSGGELNINPDVVPQTVYIRGFNLSFSYDVTAPAINSERFYRSLFVNPEIEKTN